MSRYRSIDSITHASQIIPGPNVRHLESITTICKLRNLTPDNLLLYAGF